MKISYNKLRFANEHYEVPNLVPDGLDALVAKIGAQLGAVDAAIPYGERFDGIYIVKVVACEKLPDADKLSLCKIDDGKAVKDVEREADGLVQVICGAPNVKAGMLAAWLPPGTTVPETIGKDPFVLEARAIRGHRSNGMLASAKELGISDGHDGILEVDVESSPGTGFKTAYRLDDETIIDIENKMFTHRPDCFGIMGLAREVAGIQQLPFKSPDWYVSNPEFSNHEGVELKLTVHNELPELVPRFTAITISAVEVKPSPVWLQIVLSEVGIRPINNIVDLTNFWMLETGQPLHAYDYDKVKALSNSEASIVIRNPKPDERVKLLNGKEITPRPEAAMIATDKQLIGIGGVMGGVETEVDAGTKNIILECANFDMYSIRRTAMGHGLFTEAVTRFTKGQSPLQNLVVLAKITDDICQQAGGKVAGQPIDDNHLDDVTKQRGSVHPPVKLPSDFINRRLGIKLSADEMKKILENVEFKVEINGDDLTVTAPFWRTDIELREDVVEEVGRLYGYDHLPQELPRHDLAPARRDSLLELKAKVRSRLSRAGANEVLTYSFVHGDLMTKVGQDPAKAFQISNALSPELQYYRLSLMPSLLEKVHANIKAGYDQFALFECGKTHSLDQKDKDGLPGEFEFTGLVVTANDKLHPHGAAYYQAKRYLQYVAGSAALEFKPVGDDMKQYPVVQPYDLNRTALVSIKDGDFLGIIGEFKASVRQALKLPCFTAGFEVDTTVLQSVLAKADYQLLSRFPSVKQDVTINLPADTSYQEVESKVKATLKANAPDDSQLQVEPLDIYQPDDAKASRHFTFRVTVTGANRTLTDKEVAKLLEDLVSQISRS